MCFKHKMTSVKMLHYRPWRVPLVCFATRRHEYGIVTTPKHDHRYLCITMMNKLVIDMSIRNGELTLLSRMNC